MTPRSFPSFRSLATALAPDAARVFVHRWQDPSYRASLPPMWREQLPQGWDLPGQSGASEAPKFLYRGEAGIFPQSLPSRARVASDGRFDARDIDLLDRLTDLAAEAENRSLGDRLRSRGWPQHYGLPTRFLDLTSDLDVALHFAAGSGAPGISPVRAIYRIDVEAIESEVYGLAGRRTPLVLARIEQTEIVRASRQRAWIIGARRDSDGFDLQDCEPLRRGVEKFLVDAVDAADFVKPGLLRADDDVYAAWPLAVVRALKIIAGGALPKAVAEWLCGRIPLYEWLPAKVFYDGRGRGTGFRFLTPAQARQRDGRDYEADPAAIVAELTSADIPVPNGIVFGMPTGGPPNSERWLEPGDECEVQWMTGLRNRDAKPDEWAWAAFPQAFAKVRLR